MIYICWAHCCSIYYYVKRTVIFPSGCLYSRRSSRGILRVLFPLDFGDALCMHVCATRRGDNTRSLRRRRNTASLQSINRRRRFAFMTLCERLSVDLPPGFHAFIQLSYFAYTGIRRRVCVSYINQIYLPTYIYRQRERARELGGVANFCPSFPFYIGLDALVSIVF